MAYITLNESHLESGLTAPELAAVKTAAVATGQTGAVIVAEILSQVTTEVRARVAACKTNVLGAAGTIPDECKSAAVDIAVYRICKRLPGRAVLTAERDKANDNAISFLRDVARCDVSIVAPTDAAPDEEQAGPAPAPSITAPCRKFSRSNAEGI